MYIKPAELKSMLDSLMIARLDFLQQKQAVALLSEGRTRRSSRAALVVARQRLIDRRASLDQARSRVASAVYQIAERYWPKFAKKGRPETDRDDAIQNAVLRVVEVGHRFNPACGSAFNWITKVLQREFLGTCRKTQQQEINLFRYMDAFRPAQSRSTKSADGDIEGEHFESILVDDLEAPVAVPSLSDHSVDLRFNQDPVARSQPLTAACCGPGEVECYFSNGRATEKPSSYLARRARTAATRIARKSQSRKSRATMPLPMIVSCPPDLSTQPRDCA